MCILASEETPVPGVFVDHRCMKIGKWEPWSRSAIPSCSLENWWQPCVCTTLLYGCFGIQMNHERAAAEHYGHRADQMRVQALQQGHGGVTFPGHVVQAD